MLSTCDRGPRPPQVGPGPPHAYPDPRELSAQLAAREGSGAATCHADAGAGASLPLEAHSPTHIKCEWLKRALLPLGTGQLLSVHTVARLLPRHAAVSQRQTRQLVCAGREGRQHVLCPVRTEACTYVHVRALSLSSILLV